MNILIGYKKCNTCKEVEKLMKEFDIEFEFREIDKDKPTKDEIKIWKERSGLEIKKFFNTSGKIYREMGLYKKMNDIKEEEKFDLLASDGMLVKRPILLLDDEKILVGPEVKKYLLEELK